MSSHSTPSRTTKPPAKSTKTSHSSSPLFTPMMQDRQARNKDRYSDSDDSDSPWEGPGSRFDAYGNDSYANVQLRRDAAIKLDNPELVMMLAQSRNDSIPATRLYLTKIMCGFITQEDLDAENARLKDNGDESGSGKAGKGKGKGVKK
ncbi:hypothetical protein G7Y89_g10028 [Cudoniella acicularis]|uniref:Uncharacterized protein n=1 Tax=Cudoniella acicularis TaxID=354080 RepID=A0A8H4VZK8_9HELO|nr:hypothetical protein G7Y89_g10028 [Cudoniella acicularis]